jgi:tRNA threonylcarbamoyladenosine biosynthesis protein TsaE
MTEFDITLLHDLPRAAIFIIEHLEQSKKNIVAFFGAMGAGKTTLIKEICNQLNVTSATSSPTFSIVNEYVCKDGRTIYHFDCYRIEKLSEFYDLGYEEYFYDNKALCLIEWPEKIEPLLPVDRVNVNLQMVDGKRMLKID